ncbi:MULTISPECIES: ATP-binding protein [Marinobacter]|uniref:sensor histidine kinase n=1 Tax=Marinobacter TaxID=2742 RepID=UPI000DAE4F43|nr:MULTISPECIES: ATP-binding protein [Marinobacter]
MKDKLWASFRFPLFLLLAGVGLIHWALLQVQETRKFEQEQQLLQDLSELRGTLETRIKEAIYLTRGLVFYIESQNGEYTNQRIEAWLGSMFQAGEYIINIGFAPDNRIEVIYPRTGNEAALGLYYPDMPDQWPSVQRMIRTRDPILAGPIELVQGGTAFIYRSPVFIGDDYWGLISTVIDAEALLGDIRDIARLHALRYQLRRLKDDRRDDSTLIWGEPLDANVTRQTSRIPLPGDDWLLVGQVLENPALPLSYYALPYTCLFLLAGFSGYHRYRTLQFEHKQALVRAETDRLKNEFVSTISHELRTPLTSIRGTLGLIEGGVAGPLTDKGNELVGIAKRNSDHLIHLINDLLDIDRIVEGRLDLNPQRIELNGLIRTVLTENETYAANKRITRRFNGTDGDAPAWVDETRLRQVLDNLLSNALKFSPEASTVTLTLAPVDHGWQMTVSDEGPGIPESFQDRIFKRFTQADGSSQRHAGGTGLGLAIAKGLVEQMQGSIDFETSEAGTHFRVIVPAA